MLPVDISYCKINKTAECNQIFAAKLSILN